MLNKIIKFSVENSLFVILCVFCLIILGGLSYNTIAIDAVPDITNVQVQINTEAQGLTPDVVETTVTYPIESAVSSVPGANDVRSLSRYGLSQVTVIFDDDTDIYRARQLVQERIQSIHLPANIKPELGPISTGLGEIVHYSIEAKSIEKKDSKRTMQLMKLRTIQEWDVIPRLLNVKGVAEVNTIGGYPLQYHVIPKISAMSRYGIHFDDIVEALRKSNYNTGGGFIKQSAEQLSVQGYGLFNSIKDISLAPVKRLENYETITIGDIATVKPGKEIRTGAAVINGQEGIVGTVLMLLGENSRDVSLRVADRIKEVKESLPDWVSVKVLYTRSELVNRTLTTVQKNLIFGALLVIIMLFLLLGNIRAAVITAITIPLSLLGTFIFMKATDVSISLMSLGALDFGIIIDGAVIVIDSCVSSISKRAGELKRDLSREEVKETVVSSTIEIRRAAGFGQLIIIIVFIPILALTGIEGKMFRPMALSFSFALISAFILSFTLIPSLAGILLSGKRLSEKTFLMNVIEKLYRPVFNNVLKHSRVWISISLLVLTLSGGIYVFMGGEFIPRLNEGTLSIQSIRPITINADRTVELEKLSQKIILDFKEVKDVFSRMGTPEITVHPAGIYHGDSIITLNPKEKWPVVNGRQRTIAEVAEAIRKKLILSIPGQRIMMTQPIELRFNELLEGVKSDISLKIFGDDMSELARLSGEAAEIIKSIRGSGDVEVEIRGKTPMLQIIPDTSILNRYGISKSELLDTVKIAIGGEEAGSIFEGVRSFPIIIRLSDKMRESIKAIKSIPVGVDDNLTVPMSSLAKFVIRDMYSVINRESAKRRTAVMINPRGRDTMGFVNEAKKKIKSELKLPVGYFLDWGGNYKNLITAKKRFMYLVPLCLIAVFLMIFSVFKSMWQSLLVFAAIPFAAAGGVINLFIMGLPFSISAAIGFIALSGIAVLHSLVLVSYFNRLREDGLDGDKLIQQGTLLRLRPVMMTALTDIFGFLPMMFATGTGAEIQKPLAAVVVGGVTASTLITLFLIPVMYRYALKYKG